MADAKFTEAQRSRDPLAAIELLDAMECWSEDAFCAGWQTGLASDVEDAIAGLIQIGNDFLQIDSDTLETLRRTRAACGGIWIFDGSVPGWRRFITDAEWDALNRVEPSDKWRKQRGGSR